MVGIQEIFEMVRVKIKQSYLKTFQYRFIFHMANKHPFEKSVSNETTTTKKYIKVYPAQHATTTTKSITNMKKDYFI